MPHFKLATACRVCNCRARRGNTLNLLTNTKAAKTLRGSDMGIETNNPQIGNQIEVHPCRGCPIALAPVRQARLPEGVFHIHSD